MWKFLGKGWKTVTGAAIWAVGHTGVVTVVATAVGISGDVTTAVIEKIGAALVVLGLAHKVERLDKTTPME
jgi:ABC-type sulfate transport system substrate-binding protein